MSEKKSVAFDRSPKKDKYESAEMPSRFGAAKKSDRESIEMPSSFGGSNKRTINIPEFGEVERDKVQALKRGGKVKDPTMSYQTYSKTGKPAGMKTIAVKKASGGSVSSASKRADGCAIKGKTKGRIV